MRSVFSCNFQKKNSDLFWIVMETIHIYVVTFYYLSFHLYW